MFAQLTILSDSALSPKCGIEGGLETKMWNAWPRKFGAEIYMFCLMIVTNPSEGDRSGGGGAGRGGKKLGDRVETIRSEARS